MKKEPYAHVSSVNGKTYYLHEVKAQNGKTTLYFFASNIKPESVLDSVPSGKEVVENTKGFPVLRGKK